MPVHAQQPPADRTGQSAASSRSVQKVERALLDCRRCGALIR